MAKEGSKAPSQRQLRVGEEIRHALSEVFERGDIHDPAVADTPLTVTEVRVSPDLKNATAFVMRLGGGPMDDVLGGLKRAKAFLRHEVAARMRLRYAPNLSFQEDPSFDTATRIDALLHRPDVARDLVREDDDPEDEDEDGPEAGSARGNAGGTDGA